MQGGQWRAKTDTRDDGRAAFSAGSRVIVFAVILVVAGLSACVPLYHDAGYAEVADTGTRPRTRPKPSVPVPKAALLTPQAPPDCGEAKTAEPKTAAADPKHMANTIASEQASAADVLPNTSAEPGDANATLAMRIKLEYERECYRRAEARVRARLLELQGSVKETIKSVNHPDQPGR